MFGRPSQPSRKCARVSSRPLSHTTHARLSIFHQSLSLWVTGNTSRRILSIPVTRGVGRVIVQSCRHTHRVVFPSERVSYRTSAREQFLCLRSCSRRPFATRCLAAAAARAQIAFGPSSGRRSFIIVVCGTLLYALAKSTNHIHVSSLYCFRRSTISRMASTCSAQWWFGRKPCLPGAEPPAVLHRVCQALAQGLHQELQSTVQQADGAVLCAMCWGWGLWERDTAATSPLLQIRESGPAEHHVQKCRHSVRQGCWPGGRPLAWGPAGRTLPGRRFPTLSLPLLALISPVHHFPHVIGERVQAGRLSVGHPFQRYPLPLPESQGRPGYPAAWWPSCSGPVLGRSRGRS